MTIDAGSTTSGNTGDVTINANITAGDAIGGNGIDIDATNDVTIAGTLTTTDGAAQDIDIDAGNEFTLSSGGIDSDDDIFITATADDVNLAANVIVDGNLNLSAGAASAGNILQTAGSLTVAGVSSMTVGNGGNVQVSQANQFTGGVTLLAGAAGDQIFGNVTFRDDSAVKLDDDVDAAGDLFLDAGASGVGGNLVIIADTGNITQDAASTAALTVAGTSAFTTSANDADITLTNTSNALSGTVTFTSTDTNSDNAEDVDFVNSVGVVLGGSTATGTLDVTASTGNITQTGALNVSGAASFTTSADDADITLDGSNNFLTQSPLLVRIPIMTILKKYS